MPTWTPSIGTINDLGIDCTYRQLDYWCHAGYLGEQKRKVGSGVRRSFTSTDLEVLFALSLLARFAEKASVDRRTVADAVRTRPINPGGEVLVIADGNSVFRFEHWCAHAGELTAAVCVIPLRSFASVTPTDGDVAPTDPPRSGASGVAAVPQPAATPTHST